MKDKKSLLEGLILLGDHYEKQPVKEVEQGEGRFVRAIMCYNAALNLEDRSDLFKKILQTEKRFLKSIGIKNKIDFDSYSDALKKNKATLADIRKKTKTYLERNDIKALKYHEKGYERAVAIEQLFNQIRDSLKMMLQRFIQECERILGASPCNYAVISFGSLARGEMTPYSDLEFGILIEDKGYEVNDRNKEYFKNLTKLLEIRVINLGETRIRGSRTDMPELDDYFQEIRQVGFWFDPTVKGFTYDPGRKTPLGKPGKYELIGTPEEIARYVGKEGEKIEKHLPIVVHNGWLVYTNEGGELAQERQEESELLIARYKRAVQRELLKKYKRVKPRFNKDTELAKSEEADDKNIRVKTKELVLCKVRALALIKENIERFDPKLDEIDEEGKMFKTKMEIYRIFLFDVGVKRG